MKNSFYAVLKGRIAANLKPCSVSTAFTLKLITWIGVKSKFSITPLNPLLKRLFQYVGYFENKKNPLIIVFPSLDTLLSILDLSVVILIKDLYFSTVFLRSSCTIIWQCFFAIGFQYVKMFLSFIDPAPKNLSWRGDKRRQYVKYKNKACSYLLDSIGLK